MKGEGLTGLYILPLNYGKILGNEKLLSLALYCLLSPKTACELKIQGHADGANNKMETHEHTWQFVRREEGGWVAWGKEVESESAQHEGIRMWTCKDKNKSKNHGRIAEVKVCWVKTLS